MLPHIPALRLGRAYESLDKSNVLDFRTGQTVATVSQVNAGIIRKDLSRIAPARDALKKFSVAKLIAICADAGHQFLEGNLQQSPREYIETLSSTSGLPQVMVRRNMAKIHHALTHMEVILRGLTRGLDFAVLDSGFVKGISFYPVSKCLGLVMPSNSPAVNSLWLPAIPLKIPVIIKPGRDEPWTPYRLIQAFVAAGCPAEAFGFYPTDHEGAAEILRGCGRALIFGDKNTTSVYANNPAIQIHGPGFSKVLIGDDQIERWPEFIDLIAGAISDNGGRSCINASAVVVPKYAGEIAEALARKLGPIAPLPATNENAKLAGFANVKMAEYIDGAIEEGIKTPGATDVTARFRNGPRRTQFEGATYMRPTIVLCDLFEHPLANREFLCPYASVVQVPQNEMLNKIGPSLAVTAITKDEHFIAQLIDSPLIERLNLGPISTMTVSWDQPHEGNMFEFLYKRRSIEIAK
jgi:acyl-CoA reductase-like NAD-dependent aldehyde dehydrogenase